MERKLKVMKKITKKGQMTEGITLIALIITVIVMLILAGVSISALMENEGLFARTAGAADAYKQASQKENDNLESLLNILESMENGGKVDDEDSKDIKYPIEFVDITYEDYFNKKRKRSNGFG